MKFLIWLAILPSVIIGLLVYKADKVEQEPKKELIKALLMGVFSVIITLFISWIIGIMKINFNTLNFIQIILYSFIGVAFVEEFSKWIATKLFITNNKNYNYVFDGIVYAVFVSLGFATVENILYTLSGGVITAIVRAVVTVPSHAFYAIFMGYYLSKAKESKIESKQRDNVKYTLYSIFIPTVLHGIFDSLLLLENPILLILFLFFVVFLYIISIQKVKELVRSEKLFITKKINFCSNCGAKVYGKYCSNCGKEL